MEDRADDILFSFSANIINGLAGGDYIYSLQEGYTYIYEDSYWKKIFPEEFLDRVQRNVPGIAQFSLSKRKEIIENFKIRKSLRLESFNKSPLINFENCMFDPLALVQLPHAKEHYSTIRIPYKYNPNAQCPIWIKTIGEILEENKDKIDLVQEFFGYCISPENEQKKGLLFLGDTDTGKSTLIDIAAEVIGEVNCSNVPLQYLSNPQYTPLLINKMVNIDPEVNKEAVNYEREFKILTGGKREKVSCNQKHIPTFEFTPKCKLILSANEFPRIKDHSSAFYQRLLLVPCERRFREHEKDRTLDDKLRTELPGIFNWFVEGLKRLRERGKFSEYNFMKDAIDELETENNPSNLFFEEHIEACVSDGIYIKKDELYEKYQQWCSKNGQFTLTHIKFSRHISKIFGHETPKGSRLGGNGARIWKNLRYVDFKKQYEINNVGVEEE